MFWQEPASDRVPVSILLISLSLFFFLAVLHDVWDLSSPTRDWTRSLAVRTQSPNHWTTSKFLLIPLVNQRYKGKKVRSKGFSYCDSVPTQHGRYSDGWKVPHLLSQLCKVILDSVWEFKGWRGDRQGGVNYRDIVCSMYLFNSPNPAWPEKTEQETQRWANCYSWVLNTRVPFSWASYKIQEQVQTAGSTASWTPDFLTLVIPHPEHSQCSARTHSA